MVDECEDDGECECECDNGEEKSERKVFFLVWKNFEEGRRLGERDGEWECEWEWQGQK